MYAKFLKNLTNCFKVFAYILISLIFLLILTNYMAIHVYADWEITENKTYYIDDSGKKAIGWYTIDDKTYYFSSDGSMKTGWLSMKSGKKYYLKSDGSMAIGWLKIGKNKYYFDKKGVMVTGNFKIGKKIYEFDSNGIMLKQYKDTIVPVGEKYYFVKEDGTLFQNSLVNFLETTYYVGKNGYSITTKKEIDGVCYVFDSEKGLTDYYIPVEVYVSDNATIKEYGTPSKNISGQKIITYYEAECREGSLHYKVDCLSNLTNKTGVTVEITEYAGFYDEKGYLIEDKLFNSIRLEPNEECNATRTVYVDYIPSKIVINKRVVEYM